MLIQIILILVIVLILWRIWLKYKVVAISGKEFLGWLIFWLVTIVVILLPATATYVANFLGVGRGSDLAIYLAIIILFYLIFKIFLRLDKIEKNITNLTRAEALKEKKDE